MFNTPRQEHWRQSLWNKLVVIVTLVGVLGFFSAHAGPAHAATISSPAFSSIDQTYGGPGSYHPTPAQRAYAADKGQLSDEYVQRVLPGQETLAAFETHYRAFMIKWHLGNVANLHTVLTEGTARLLSQIVPDATGAAQFPEEHYNWCGPAALSTTLVEDSFKWPGANSYNGFTLSYNPNVTSQAASTAYNDEYWLASNGLIQGDIWNNGAGPNDMLTWANYFVTGKGGQYAEEWLSGSLSSQVADFTGKVVSDIGTGWDVPTGIWIHPGNFTSLPGYPTNHGEIDHWLPVTWISPDHNTTYYSDPIYNAPDYKSWPIPPLYEHTPTSNIVLYAGVIIW